MKVNTRPNTTTKGCTHYTASLNVGEMGGRKSARRTFRQEKCPENKDEKPTQHMAETGEKVTLPETEG